MKALNLTNHIFGKLTALAPLIKCKKRGWTCLCTCGRYIWVSTSELNRGYITNCKHYLHKQSIRIGDRFGKLIVDKIYIDETSRRYKTTCTCDCGNVRHNVAIRNLQRGTATHCGCSRDTSNLGLPEGVAARNSLISSYRCNAKQKGLVFELSVDECVLLFNGNCYLCGIPPNSVHTKKGVKGSYTYSSIDRIDSDMGYVVENTASCCSECNYLKLNRTNANFLAHLKRIIDHQSALKGH